MEYKTVLGEIIKIDQEKVGSDALAFLVRCIQMAHDPEVNENDLIEVAYSEENPILKPGIIKGRGFIDQEALDHPLYPIFADLISLKGKNQGTFNSENALKQYSLTVSEASEFLGISPSAIRQAIKAHKLAAIKKDGQHWIIPASVKSYKVGSRHRKRETPALTVCFGTKKGSGALIPKFVNDIEMVTKNDQGLKEGVVMSFLSAAILTNTQGDKRFFRIVPGPDNEMKFNGFFIKGKFKIIEKINNPRGADKAFKTFTPA